jgi:hypothetical protein
MTLLVKFISLPSWLQILLWAVCAVAVGGLVTLVIRWSSSDQLRAEHNEQTGVVVAIVGFFYGLVVTALLVQAVGHFNEARAIVEREANLTEAVVRSARATSPELGEDARRYMLRYLHQVSTKEWPLQRIGQTQGISVNTLDTFYTVIQRFDPQDDKHCLSYSVLLGEMEKLYGARKARSFRMHMEVSAELWGVTIVGWVALVTLAMLMHLPSAWMHFLLACATSVSISIVCALILIFDTPFIGVISISPEPYEMAWHHLGGED